MSKKKLGYDPFDELDILKGPQKSGGENTGISTRENTRISTRENTRISTRENTRINTRENTRINTRIIAGRESPVKRTFYFYPGQLKEIDRLSKKTGRPKTELIRLALDYFFEQVNN